MRELRLMYKETIGDLLYQIRKERKISQIQLSKNICSQKTISNIESNKFIPNRLLFNILLERLGESPEYFKVMLSKKEFQYFEWKRGVIKNILDGKNAVAMTKLTDEAKNLEEKRQNGKQTIHYILQKQFVEFYIGYLTKNKEQISNAIELTVSNYRSNNWNKECISSTELNMIILDNSLEHNDEDVKNIKKCLEYMDLHYSEKERAKIYPKAVELVIQYEQCGIIERIVYCENALNLMRKYCLIEGMDIILASLALDYSIIDRAIANKYEYWLRAFEYVREEYNIKQTNNHFVQSEMNQQIHLVDEVIKSYREESEFDKAELIDYIDCAETTYLDIENGKRKAHISTYKKISQELGIYINQYSMDVITNNYECVKKADLIMRLFNQNKEKEIYNTIKFLDNKLDMQYIENYQFVEMCKNCYEFLYVGKNREKFRENTKKTLQITIPDWNQNRYKHYFTRIECCLIFQLILTCSSDKDELDLNNKVLLFIWKKLNNSKVSLTNRSKEILLLLLTWKNIYSKLDCSEIKNKIINEGLRLAFEYNQGDKIGLFLYDSMNNNQIRNRDIVYYSKAFFEIYENQINASLINNDMGEDEEKIDDICMYYSGELVTSFV